MDNKKSGKNKFKKGLTITILLIFLIALVTLFLLWRFNNATKINETQFRTALVDKKYKNGKSDPANITEFDDTSVGLGQNSVIVTGEFRLDNDKIVRYQVEFSVYDYNHPLNPSDKEEQDSSINNILLAVDIDKNDSIHTLLNNATGGDYSQVDREFVPMWESLLIQMVPLILLIGALVWVFSRVSKGAGGMGSPFSMGKNRARQVTSTVKFSDVAGIEEEKLELTELVDYLKNNQKYVKQGARIPRGVLMEGPPGTGKTLLAKAVAGEAGVPFLSISGSEFEEMFVGVGASRIREMFNLAKKNSPSIIFIDEIDAVGRKRASSLGAGTNEQTLNQLLVEMDGFGTDSGVIVMAATNRVDVLDTALLRPGRFDRQITIPLPDVNAREAILKLHARNKKISQDVSFRRVAERTPGFSGAQLENVLNEAIILTIREKRNLILISDIDEAIDRVVAGPAKKSRAMRLIDKKIVSYHEAGHALVGLKVENASKVQKVTIIPRGNAGGYTIMTPKEEIAFHSKEQLFAMIKGFLGGRAAEAIIFGKNQITTGAHDDLEKATSIARKMIAEYGMSSLGIAQIENSRQQAMGIQPRMSETLSTKIDNEINRVLDECYKETHSIILANKDLLELLAESLRVLETITAEQIEYINKNRKLPLEVIEAKERQKRMEEKEKKGHLFKIKPNDIYANTNKKSTTEDNKSIKKSSQTKKVVKTIKPQNLEGNKQEQDSKKKDKDKSDN